MGRRFRDHARAKETLMADLSYGTFINDPIDELHALYGNVLMDTSYALASAVSVIIFALYLVASAGSLEGILLFFFRYTGRLTLSFGILRFYYQPMTWLGTNLSFHQLAPAICDHFVSVMDMKRMDIMFAYLTHIMLSMQAPAWDWRLQLVAATGEGVVTIFKAACWVSIALSYIAVGAFNLLLPLVVWTIMVPSLSYLFRNAYTAIWEYSFYRIMASAIVFCASTSLMAFLYNTFNGNYDLALFAAILGKMIALMLAWVCALIRIGVWVSNFWRGGSSGGGLFGNFVTGIRRGVVNG